MSEEAGATGGRGRQLPPVAFMMWGKLGGSKTSLSWKEDTNVFGIFEMLMM